MPTERTSSPPSAEKTLLELIRRNELILQTTSEGFILGDSQGAIIDVNPAYCHMAGYSREELLTMNIRDLERVTPPEEMERRIKQLIARGSDRFETKHERKDGSLLELDVSTNIIKADGIPFVAAFVRDISERKQAERVQSVVYRVAQAVGSAANLGKLFSIIHQLLGELMKVDNFYISLYDEKTNLISFPYFIDEIDVPGPPQKPGKGLTEYILRTGKSLLCDEETHRKLMEQKEAEMVGEPSAIWLGVPLIVGENVIGVMVVQDYRDPQAYGHREREILEYVSSQIARAIDLKRTEEALAEQKSYFQQLFEQSPAGIVYLDPDDNVVDINPAFQKIFQYAISELRGKKINDFIVPHNRILEAGRFSTRSQKGELVQIEGIRKRKDGSIVDVRMTGYPVTIEGSQVGVFGIFEDISEQKRLQAQFIQAQKMESLGTLAGGVAHDFNNILGIIIGHSSIVKQLAKPSEQLSRSIDAILSAGNRGASLVRQLLTFARKSEILLAPVSLNDTVEEVVGLLETTFPKTITFSADLASPLPNVTGDGTQLHQVILNLCVNARDAMPGGGNISLRTSTAGGERVRIKHREAGSDEYVMLQIADTGEGMDEETLKRLFEPFFTTKGVGKGTGLGLAVVFGIIQSHDGFVDVESERGEGTTFTMYLPVRAATTEGAPAAPEEAPEVPGGRETILLIEDEELLRELTKSILEGKGYTVVTAKTGDEATEVYSDNWRGIDLVFTDMGLPGLSGYDVLKKLQSINPAVRFVFASGYIGPEEKAKTFELGALAFLQKPYTAEDVLGKIREVLDKR